MCDLRTWPCVWEKRMADLHVGPGMRFRPPPTPSSCHGNLIAKPIRLAKIKFCIWLLTGPESFHEKHPSERDSCQTDWNQIIWIVNFVGRGTADHRCSTIEASVPLPLSRSRDSFRWYFALVVNCLNLNSKCNRLNLARAREYEHGPVKAFSSLTSSYYYLHKLILLTF